MDPVSQLYNVFAAYQASLELLHKQLPMIAEVADTLASTVRRNGRIFIAGNGGSHSLGEHLCAELIGRLSYEARPVGAFVLQNCTPVTTALSNDYRFEIALARELDALARPGDVFLAISASGESRNLVEAALRANEMGLTTVCLVGRSVSPLGDGCHVRLATPSPEIVVVQQVHLVVVHLIWLALEQVLGAGEPAG
ncbi:MAG TPA: SIS domain-containing protein [Actinophytocola sp.]|uniref:D-sedoheptulose-7-phosphate isomerase n=1 Tax=Actinophytocola sp. TaxID=1872138 RepID=UPI002DDCF891|nr:SIS domain-containing protein [Actinophytocola sp.]HEV2781345.1 SIS domain-containing protein [Actinophytocola sp.]